MLNEVLKKKIITQTKINYCRQKEIWRFAFNKLDFEPTNNLLVDTAVFSLEPRKFSRRAEDSLLLDVLLVVGPFPVSLFLTFFMEGTVPESNEYSENCDED